MSEQEPHEPHESQKPIEDEFLWGEPGQTAQAGEGAVLPADITEAEAEAEIILDSKNDEQEPDQGQE